jgi:hypothetical protein
VPAVVFHENSAASAALFPQLPTQGGVAYNFFHRLGDPFYRRRRHQQGSIASTFSREYICFRGFAFACNECSSRDGSRFLNPIA